MLDTRDFEALLRQARLRIPRYTPEWTDFNDSDPGMALVQLFAWLTEMMLFEMNRVPELTYVKFLQLLGMELAPAQPARAHLTFAVQQNAPQAGPVPERTQVMALPADGGDPLIFETTRGLSLSVAGLEKVLVFNGAGYDDETVANTEPGTRYAPFGWEPQPGSALYLGFKPPEAGTPGRPFASDLRFRVLLPIGLDETPSLGCRDAVRPPVAPVTLVWEYLPREGAPNWRRLELFEDETVAFTREGYISIAGPPPEIEAAKGPKATDEPRFWLRCRLAGGRYPMGLSPEIEAIRPNTVEAENLSTVRDELVEVSEGFPDQVFVLRRRPVQPDSLRLTVEREDGTPEPWERRDDLLSSGRDDPHYVLNATTGELRFGDGERGRVPPAGAEIVAVEYRAGGGRAGNVPVGAVQTLLGSVPGVDGATNERPAVGGADEQRVEDLAREAPARLRRRDRAVTAEDFRSLAMEAGGVAKATALDLAHPDHPDVEVPGAVTVVIVPEAPEIENRRPTPSAEQLRSVCRYLDDYRLLTTELHVVGPVYQSIRVETTVDAQPYASLDAVGRDVRKALDEYLDPLGRTVPPPATAQPAAGAAVADGAAGIVVPRATGAGGWPFGRELYPSSLFGVILQVPGVVAVSSLTLAVDGRTLDPLPTFVRVPRDGLIASADDHVIRVRPARDV